DKNFKTYVIKSLVDITNRVKRCEFLLKKKQYNSEQNLENQVYDSENILDEKFSVKSLDEIKDIEQQLKHDEIFKKQIISALYSCSQSTMKKTVTRIMKILFTDDVAAQFSWTGQKENKKKFEVLYLWKIIFGMLNRIKI
ncbi:PREDICTED: uncharacterized protein LOC105556443, partial [Vollenhovia emeryi]|uniref:uncharacterized protein LOC105556443 n=1 Tax=Vollenhovia emeryi TaxID=411798 RepID=UPI0005F3FB5B